MYPAGTDYSGTEFKIAALSSLWYSSRFAIDFNLSMSATESQVVEAETKREVQSITSRMVIITCIHSCGNYNCLYPHLHLVAYWSNRPQ